MALFISTSRYRFQMVFTITCQEDYAQQWLVIILKNDNPSVSLSFSHYLRLSSFSSLSWSHLKRVPLALPCSLHATWFLSSLSLHRPHDSAFSKRHSDKYYNSRLCEYTALSTSSELKLAVYILDNVENNCVTYPTNNTRINDVGNLGIT